MVRGQVAGAVGCVERFTALTHRNYVVRLCGLDAPYTCSTHPTFALGGGGDARIAECRFKAVTSKRLAVRPLVLRARDARWNLNPNLGWRHPASNRRVVRIGAGSKLGPAMPVVPVRRRSAAENSSYDCRGNRGRRIRRDSHAESVGPNTCGLTSRGSNMTRREKSRPIVSTGCW